MELRWSIFSKYKDELYGLSILWIMLFHGLILKNCRLYKEFAFWDGIIKNGNCGVEIFLFVSGICLYYSMKKNPDITSFYLRRIKRLLPPFLLIDGLYWGWTCLVKKHSLVTFLKNITFYSFWAEGNSQVWFLALIVLLYLAYPLIFKYVSTDSLRSALIKTILLCLGIYAFCILLRLNSYQYYRSVEIALTRFPAFFLGCWCGRLSYEDRPINKHVIKASFLFMLLGLMYFSYHHTGLIKSLRTPYLFAGTGLAVWLCIALEVLQLKYLIIPLRFLGKISLELYLTHICLRSIFTKTPFYKHSPTTNYVYYIVFCIIGSIVIGSIFSAVRKFLAAK